MEQEETEIDKDKLHNYEEHLHEPTKSLDYDKPSDKSPKTNNPNISRLQITTKKPF